MARDIQYILYELNEVVEELNRAHSEHSMDVFVPLDEYENLQAQARELQKIQDFAVPKVRYDKLREERDRLRRIVQMYREGKIVPDDIEQLREERDRLRTDVEFLEAVTSSEFMQRMQERDRILSEIEKMGELGGNIGYMASWARAVLAEGRRRV